MHTLDVLNSAPAGYIARLKEITGSEEAARLLLTVLAGYPIAAVHQICVRKLGPLVQNLFFATCGLLLCYFNFGLDCYHSAIGIWTTYLLTRLLPRSPRQFLALSVAFHMSYLLIGYFCTESNSYDIRWTTPHCVLVLRLIGVSFDIIDGQKPREELSREQKERALAEAPSLIELLGYTYFPASFLVGPQFSFRRYKGFIEGEFNEYHGFIRAGLVRFLLGGLYFAMWQAGAIMFPDSYLLSDAFRKQSLLRKLIDIGLWGKFAIYKYISCWLLVEGAMMCTGITYAGRSADGTEDWSGCTNVRLILLETGTAMSVYVQSFNVNTNIWLSLYVYKRLKFLNNRIISYMAALSFMALWHGFHSGYYITFFSEFCLMVMEKQIETMYSKIIVRRYGDVLNSSQLTRAIVFVLLRAYNVFYMSFSLVPFVLLNFDRWHRVFESVNYFGFVMVGCCTVLYNVTKFSGALKGTRGRGPFVASVKQE